MMLLSYMLRVVEKQHSLSLRHYCLSVKNPCPTELTRRNPSDLEENSRLQSYILRMRLDTGPTRFPPVIKFAVRKLPPEFVGVALDDLTIGANGFVRSGSLGKAVSEGKEVTELDRSR